MLSQSQSPREAQPSSMEILLVDDHSLFRSGLIILLQKLDPDMVCIEADSCEQGIKLFSDYDYDLVIVDYNLPGDNGIELLKHIKQQSPATPVVVISGSEELAVIRNALNHGASGFVPKNLQSEQIVEAFELVLNGAIYVPESVLSNSSHTAGDDSNSDKQLQELAQRILKQRGTSVQPSNDDSAVVSTDTFQLLNSALDEIERERQKLEEFAFHDSLTGLPNRRLFEDRLRQGLQAARRHRQLTGLVLLDLDYFKQVNDNHGHDVGDALLQLIAERLNATLRSIDTAARLGGDEFALILGEIDEQADAEIALQRIFNTLSLATTINKIPITPSVSIGVSLSDGSEGIDKLYKQADQALYRSKQQGRNSFTFYTPDSADNSAANTRSTENTP